MSHLLCVCWLYSICSAHFKGPHHAKGCCSGEGHVCSVNTASALLLEMYLVYHCEPWFRNTGAIKNCTALLLPSDLPCSLPTSLVLAPQLYSTCSCPTVPAMPFLQLCQIPFLSIAIMLFNCKFLIFTKLTHHIDPVFCGIFHKKYLSDTKQKILMSSLCLEIETQ